MTSAMGLKDCVSYVFAGYLNWMDDGQCLDLADFARAGGEPEIAGWIKRVLRSSPEEVRGELAKPGDEEDRLAWINKFLRLQGLGLIGKEEPVALVFDSISDPWLVHRQAAINGNVDVFKWELLTLPSRRRAGYLQELDWLLKAYARPEKLADDDYYSYLCMLLNVALPASRDESLWKQAGEFAEFLLRNRDESFLSWLSPTNFMVLAHDLRMDPERLQPFFGPLVTRRSPGLSDYLGWMLGIRMLGDPARVVLEEMKPIGGMRLLEVVSG